MLESELSELRLLINTRVLDETEESSMTERDQGDNFWMTICSISLSLLAVRRVWAVRIIQEGKLECFCLSNNIYHVNKQWVPDETEESSMTGRDEIELAVPCFYKLFFIVDSKDSLSLEIYFYDVSGIPLPSRSLFVVR